MPDAKATPADRHKRPPLSLRPPDALEDWYRTRAKTEGGSVSALVITAMEEHRARVEADTQGDTKS